MAQVEPSGKRFLLGEEKVRVKVEDGKIQRMQVLAHQCNTLRQPDACPHG
jgi:hypothetical protein